MNNFSYDLVIVGGCGHAGLPLAVSFAEAGLKVCAYDINQQVIQEIRSGKIPFVENGMETSLPKVLEKTFFLSADQKALQQAPAVIVTIGTPIDEHINPQFTPLMKFIREVEPLLKDSQTLIMRSTVFPGTMENIRNFFEEKKKGVSLCFCPERLAEGKALEELKSLPQIVSSFDGRGLETASLLFRKLTEKIIPLNPLEAELAKLFTNTWRYIKFSIANQFYQMAESSGAKFYKIWQAMREDYPRAQDFPKAGFAAGPCLFKDTMQLASFYNHNFFLGHAAMLVNEGMPDYIRDQLKKQGSLRKKKIGILGMTFKGNMDDTRESLAFKLRKILLFEGAQVYCSDEYWKGDRFVEPNEFLSKEELLKQCDIVIIGAPHEGYQSLNYSGKTLIDIWNHIP
ncbi:MAG: nucleotide sugar dehydrogenase [Deltaproteobacteria bacterium]|nr:nucleotide sugar dehydrogenase [Deltaproteobacteria bacterium]